MIQRCGWCIDGRHDHCVVVVEMGVKQTNSTLKYAFAMPKSKTVAPYFWRCGCGCERSFDTKCVKCQRVGVDVKENRCVADCSHVKPLVQPKVKGDTR